ncbi:MAG: VOC family protein [Chloroflexota bacterium]
MININHIDHVAIVVSNLEQSISFYVDVLGFRVIKHLKFPDRELVMLHLGDNPSSKIELLRYDATDPSIPVSSDRTLKGLRHLAFRVSNIRTTFEFLTSKGVQMIEDQPFLRQDGPPIAFGYDPDGILLEFTEL